MKNKILSSLIIICALVGVGWGSASHAEAAISEWQKGASMQPFSTTDLGSDAAKRSLDALRATGANHVTFIIPYYQNNRQSTAMYPSWNTPTDEALITAITYAKSIGFEVGLKPHLETDYIEWRGNINPAPADRPAWYNSYATMLEHYGRIAETHGVADYCIGTELILMANPNYDSMNTTHWKQMIARVRAVYSGDITYSANWYGELDTIEFWEDLDYIGVSAYYDLYHAQNNSVEELKKSWDGWRSGVLEPIQKQYNMPIMFTELGYRSIQGAYRDPWDWSRDGVHNEYDQAQSYRALFEYWNDYPWMKGVHLWRWEIQAPAANSGDKDYTPQNKLAESVMKEWWGGTTPPRAAEPPVTPPADPGTVQGTTWTSSVAVSPENPGTGTTVSLTSVVKNTSSANVSNAIVDVEVYNPSGTRVAQKFFEGQSFTGGQSKSYNASWTPSDAGNYTVKVGVFNGNWTHSYYWNDVAKTVAVGGATTPPAGSALEIWWPGNGVTVSGLQPFKAMLSNRDVSTYNMYWQVDGDRLNDMHDDSTDYPHKEALVNLTGWNWKGIGPYNINFVAKDKNGAMLQQKAVDIKVAQ